MRCEAPAYFDNISLEFHLTHSITFRQPAEPRCLIIRSKILVVACNAKKRLT